MRVIITGATGFVGTHLRKYLLRNTEWLIYGTSYPDAPPQNNWVGPRQFDIA